MIQKRLIVKGRVQDVEYRELVKEISIKMDVLGNVRNLRDRSVEIFCECKNKQHLEDYKKEIWKKEKNENKPFVEDIEEISISNAHLSYFDIDYGDKQEEMIKKLNKGIQVMTGVSNSVKSMNKNLGNKMDLMNKNICDSFKKLDDKYGSIGDSLKELVNIFKNCDIEIIPKKKKKK